MAVLSSWNALGANVGDVYGTKQVIRVIADGVYVFGDLPTPVAIKEYDSTQAYSAGDLVVRLGAILKAVSAIPANTSFAYGTTGATWAPLLNPGYQWLGAYNPLTTYVAGDVVTNGLNHLWFSAAGASPGDTPGAAGSSWTPFEYYNTPKFTGTNGVTPGKVGLVPAPSALDAGKVLGAGGNWVVPSGIRDWATATAYAVGDYLNESNKLYKVLIAHTSAATIAADITANKVVEVSATGYDWRISTNNMTLVDNDNVVVQAGHTLNMPVAPTAGQSVRCAPAGDWATLNATFQSSGTTTVGAGQTLPTSGDVCEFVYDAVADNWVAFLGGSGSPVKAITVDAATANVTITLPAATGSGDIKFYTLKDKTNTATLAVQAGEQLSDVINGTFLFSNYAVGTQFVATDRATGKWDVVVLGAATSAGLGYIQAGRSVNVALTTAIGTKFPFDVVNGSRGITLSGGSFTLPAGATYILRGAPQMNVGGSGVFQDFRWFNETTNAFVGSTMTAQVIQGNTGPINAYAEAIITATVATTVSLRMSAVNVGATYTASASSAFIQALPSAEVVLAGMVAPTPLSRIMTTTSGSVAVTNGNAIPFNVISHTSGSSITHSAGVFTLAENKTYRLYGTPGSGNEASTRVGFTWRITGGMAVADIGVSGNFIPPADGYNAPPGCQPAVAILTTTTATTVILKTDTAYTGGGVAPSNLGSVNRPVALIEELPNSQVVNPDTVPIETLANGSAFATPLDAQLPGTALSPATAVVVASATLPNIGTYEIDYRLFGATRASQTGNLSGAIFMSPTSTVQMAAGGGTLVPDSEIIAVGTPSTAISASIRSTGSGTVTVTTTVANTVVSLQAWQSQAGGSVDITSSASGRCGLVYRQLPVATVIQLDPLALTATPLTRAFASAASQSTGLAAGSPLRFTSSTGDVPYDTGTFRFTLSANKRYRLTANIDRVDGGATGVEVGFCWYNVTAGAFIGASASCGVATVTSIAFGGSAEALIDTTTTTVVEARISKVNGSPSSISSNGTSGAGLYAIVEELPITNVIDPGTVPVQTLATFQSMRAGADSNTSIYSITPAVNISASVAKATGQRLQFTTAQIAEGVTLGTNTATIVTTGRYRVSALVSADRATATADDITLEMCVNGSIIHFATTTNNAGNHNEFLATSGLVDLTAGQVIDWRLGAGTTTAINVYSQTVAIEQVPSSTVVNAGTVPVQTLHTVSLATNATGNNDVTQMATTIGSGYEVFDLDDPQFNYVLNPNGLLNFTNNSVTIVNSGRYEITCNAETDAAAGSQKLTIYKNGARLVGAPGSNLGANGATNSISIVADLVATDRIEFGEEGTAATGWRRPNITVKQLPVATVIDPSTVPVTNWTPYTPTITGTTTNPTLATTRTVKASYCVIDKMMKVNVLYFAASGTGAANGSGVYGFSIPAGYTIDTSIVNVPTTIAASAAGLDGSILGTAQARNTSTTLTGGAVMPISATSLTIVDSGLQMVGSTSIGFTSANTYYRFVAEFPVV